MSHTPTTEEVRGMFGDVACNRLDLEMEDHDSGCPADLAFDRWLAGVKAQAWEEGATAAWLESGIRTYGDDYPRDNPTWLPFSVRKTNPYKEEA